jgi:hypothetical protein
MVISLSSLSFFKGSRLQREEWHWLQFYAFEPSPSIVIAKEREDKLGKTYSTHGIHKNILLWESHNFEELRMCFVPIEMGLKEVY